MEWLWDRYGPQTPVFYTPNLVYNKGGFFPLYLTQLWLKADMRNKAISPQQLPVLVVSFHILVVHVKEIPEVGPHLSGCRLQGDVRVSAFYRLPERNKKLPFWQKKIKLHMTMLITETKFCVTILLQWSWERWIRVKVYDEPYCSMWERTVDISKQNQHCSLIQHTKILPTSFSIPQTPLIGFNKNQD